MKRRRTAGGSNERILALDTSSVCIGWAVFDEGELIKSGRYRIDGTGHGEKLVAFRGWLAKMLVEWKPAQLVYERPFAGRRRHAFGVLSLYVAVLAIAHWEFFGTEIPDANSVPAREVKRRNKMRKGTSHDQNKKIGVLLANQLYGLSLKFKSNDKTKKVSEDDRADAILLGRAWLISERAWLIE